MLRFSWDAAKASSNLKKHGVSFEEAQSVFYDEFAIQFEDDSDSGEQRFLLLGMSCGGRVLVVVHCERGPDGQELRIISARKAWGLFILNASVLLALFCRPARQPMRSVAGPHEQRLTRRGGKTGPALRVESENAPLRVARQSFGTTKLAS